MEFVEIMKIKRRMCKTDESECTECPFDIENNGVKLLCEEFMSEYPEKAEEILKRWAEDHPQKTVLLDFLEKYPNAELNEEGVPKYIGTYALGYPLGTDWNRPLEGLQ